MDSTIVSPRGDKVYEKMEEDLTCPVCLELYADPLMMPCSHSICKTCLNDIKMTREKANKTEFECPSCREAHRITADLLDRLPKNLALENIVFRFQEIKSTSLSRSDALFDQAASTFADKNSDEDADTDDVFDDASVHLHCGMCDDNQGRKAEWFCPQCDVLYCQNCLNTFHPRKGSLGRHKICKPIQKKVMRGKPVLLCPEHTEERASIFCDTCKTVACHLCVCQGQGIHGHHVILDMSTAKDKTQATFNKATDDLTLLMSALSSRDKETDSQLETIKALHQSALTQITSQFQCFMADIASTLQLAKLNFLEKIKSDSSLQSEPVMTKSKHIKSALDRCLTLMARCNNLVSQDLERKLARNIPNLEEARHLRARSLPEQFSVQTSDHSLSSCEGSPPLSLEHQQNSETVVKGRRSLSLLDQKEVSFQPTPESSHQYRAKGQDDSNAENKSFNSASVKMKAFSEQRAMMTSTPIPQAERTDKPSRMKSKSVVSSEMEGQKERSPNQGTSPRASKQVGHERKREKKNSPLNLSPKNLSEDRKENLKKKSDICMSSGAAEFSTCGKMNQEESLLVQASEIEQILQEIAQLTKGLDLMVSQEEDVLSDLTRKVSASVSSFTDFAVNLLSDLSSDNKVEVSDIPILIPSVRSVASPLSPGQKGMPRVQSRTLITWGFSSTSFTAEPVRSSGQWSVNITRNTSHIGDVKSGYLFGVGVATRGLASKQLVGMTSDSYGIVCSQGCLAFCHDSHMTPITPLTDLPLSIRLAVTTGRLGVVLSYWLFLPGTPGTVQGRRLIALHGKKRVSGSGSNDERDGDCCSARDEASSTIIDDGGRGDGKFESETTANTNTLPMLPVFTVSQRVKMQFPLASEGF